MTRLIRLTLILGLLLLAVPVAAQAPGPPLSCDDHLRASQIQLQATTLSQIRERGDAARELAALHKQIEQLQAQVVKLTPKKDPPKPAAPPPEEKK